MAENESTAVAVTAADESTSVPTTTVKQAWADYPDDEPEAPSTSEDKEKISTSEDKEKIQIELDSLKIDESKKINKFLDDPEDSSIETVPSGDTPYTSAKSFEDLNLSDKLLDGLYVEMRFEKPSKIQAITLPMILTPPYKNLIAQAHNGSGKTTCFVLGMLSRVDPGVKAPQALCICPTRELANQNIEVLQRMGKFTGITWKCAVPDGSNYIPVSKMAPISEQVIIGTPGTINKWCTKKKLGMSQMKVLVFDEADHMLAESGFKDSSVRIMKEIVRYSPDCQVLLFSATFNENVKAFVSKIVKELFVKKEYNQMFVKKEELSLESVKQYKVDCPDELSKVMVIRDKILDLGRGIGQTIIFVATRNSARHLHLALTDKEYGYSVTTIQGALKQEDRDKIVKEFKDGYTKILISTDLLARGFDQSQVNVVINYDLPVVHDKTPPEPDCEVYLHRIGRAGRFGRKGAIFNLLCCERDRDLMQKIEQHFNHPATQVPSWDSDEDFVDALKKAGLR